MTVPAVIQECTVDIIGLNAFNNASGITAFMLPESVCYIGSNAFSSCDSLKKVVFTGVCPAFANVAFDWLPIDAVVYVPDDQYDAYSTAFTAMKLYLTIQPGFCRMHLRT